MERMKQTNKTIQDFKNVVMTETKKIVFKERHIRKMRKNIAKINEQLMATKLEIKLM